MKAIPLLPRLVLFACGTIATAQHGIYFDYHHPDPDQPVHIDHPHVDGVFLRFSWADLEPAKGQFDFSSIDRNIATWAQAGKRVLFGVALGGQQQGVTPDWLYNEVPAIDFIRSGKETRVRNPKYWDKAFLPAVSGLIKELGNRYGKDERVEAVMIGVGHIGFVVAAPNRTGAQAFLDAGWSPEAWKDYTMGLCDLYRKAFGDKSLFLRGSSLVLREPDPAKAGFPDSRADFLEVRDEILLEVAQRYSIGIGCNGLEADPSKFLSTGIPALYQQLAPGAIAGNYSLEISDDWPLWVNAERRARSGVDAKADNAYFKHCLDIIGGNRSGLPNMAIGWVKMLETDLDCTHPAHPDYQPDCEEKLVWLKEQLLKPPAGAPGLILIDPAQAKINGIWTETTLQTVVAPLMEPAFREVRTSFSPAEPAQLHGIRFSLQLDKILSPANDWVVFGEDYNSLRQGTILSLESITQQEECCWFTCLYSAKTSQVLVLAAATANQWPTWFKWTRAGNGQPGLTVRHGGIAARESIRVMEDTMVDLDPLIVGYWRDITPQQAMMRTAELVGQKMHRSAAPRRPQQGWCSWMYHAGRVSAEDVDRAAKFMSENLKETGYSIVQVDGGWWNDRGLWQANERFPDGMQALGERIHSLDMQYGLHFSPFRVDAASPLVTEHPDWMVRDISTGSYLGEEGNMKFRVLDGSHPDAVQYIRDTIRRLVVDGKVDYLKLDFLDHGADEGLRHDPQKSGIQAMTNILRAIRESVPSGTIILGCNLPGLAGAAYVDSVRVGPDINKVGMGHVGPNGEHANMRWGDPSGDLQSDHQTLVAQAQAVARQFYTHRAMWINDADTVMVTPDYSLEEARAHMTLVALTGGTLMSGDRLDTLPAERLQLLKHREVRDIWQAGQHAVPIDLFGGDPVPSLWKLDLPQRTILGIFNWSGKQTSRSWSLKYLGLDASHNYSIRDVWTGDTVDLRAQKISLQQAPHSVRLLELRKSN